MNAGLPTPRTRSTRSTHRPRTTRRLWCVVVLCGWLVWAAAGCSADATDAQGVDAAADGGTASDSAGSSDADGDMAGDVAGDAAGDGFDSPDAQGRGGDAVSGSDTNGGQLVCPGQPGCPCEASDECDDGDPCTVDGPCDGGACQGKSPAVCDDGKPCTVDSCEAATGCVHAMVGGPCEDGDPCTAGDTCTDKGCVAGTDQPCDDGNVCTDDSCTPGVGCTFKHNTAECVPENACAQAGVCSFSYCVPGKLKPCSDSKACTYSVCDPTTGCAHVNLPAETTCTGGAVRDGRCYKAFSLTQGLGWVQARASCKAWGGELATVHSRQANDLARAQADAVCGKGKTAWIGLNDRMREGIWRWGDSSTIDYQNWGSGEPNNAGNEDAISLRADGMWNDVSDDATKSKAGCWVCSRRLPVACKGGSGSTCLAGATCAAGSCDTSTAGPDTCDDQNACTADSCAKGSCGHVPLPKGATCTLGACVGAVCRAPSTAPSSTTLPPSCKAVLDADSGATSGVYWLQPAGLAAPVSAHCDMGPGGDPQAPGGWTLVLKTQGKAADFGYDGKRWASKPTLPVANPGPEPGEALLPTYWTVPVTEVRVVMTRKQQTREVVLAAKGASLHALVNGKQATTTDAGLPKWGKLLSDASLQKSCHAEGIALSGKLARVRIGIVGNNENNCSSPDSWIGVGGTDSICGGKKGVFSGNLACYGANRGNKTVAAPTWVYVR